MQAIVTLSQHRYEKDPELTVNKHQCPETRRSLANYINKAKITVCLSFCVHVRRLRSSSSSEAAGVGEQSASRCAEK